MAKVDLECVSTKKKRYHNDDVLFEFTYSYVCPIDDGGAGSLSFRHAMKEEVDKQRVDIDQWFEKTFGKVLSNYNDPKLEGRFDFVKFGEKVDKEVKSKVDKSIKSLAKSFDVLKKKHAQDKSKPKIAKGEVSCANEYKPSSLKSYQYELQAEYECAVDDVVTAAHIQEAIAAYARELRDQIDQRCKESDEILEKFKQKLAKVNKNNERYYEKNDYEKINKYAKQMEKQINDEIDLAKESLKQKAPEIAAAKVKELTKEQKDAKSVLWGLKVKVAKKIALAAIAPGIGVLTGVGAAVLGTVATGGIGAGAGIAAGVSAVLVTLAASMKLLKKAMAAIKEIMKDEAAARKSVKDLVEPLAKEIEAKARQKLKGPTLGDKIKDLFATSQYKAMEKALKLHKAHLVELKKNMDVWGNEASKTLNHLDTLKDKLKGAQDDQEKKELEESCKDVATHLKEVWDFYALLEKDYDAGKKTNEDGEAGLEKAKKGDVKGFRSDLGGYAKSLSDSSPEILKALQKAVDAIGKALAK